MNEHEILPTLFGILLALWLGYEIKKAVTKKEVPEVE